MHDLFEVNGQVVAVIEGGAVYYVRTDHIGRPVFATDIAGVVVWGASYLPFGGVHTSTGPTIGLRFPGQWFQSEAGLHQNWMRDYDPTLGRYIQADPLGLVDGASVYGYVRQNPGRYIDPRGEFGIPGAFAGAALGGAIGYYKTGCLQGALAGAAIGAVAGGFGPPLSSALGGNSVLAGTMTGFGASVASQLANNEIAGMCGCAGEQLPVAALVTTPEFWITNAAGSLGGSFGGLIGSSSSIVGGWAAGYGVRSFVSGLVGGSVSNGVRNIPSSLQEK